MKNICRSLFVLFAIIGFVSFGVAQQGKKIVTMDNDDLSPLARTVETLNAGVMGWAPITPPDSGFSVIMPGAVSSSIETEPTGPGKVISHVYRGELSGREYESSYSDYTFPLDESMAESGFDGIRSRMARYGFDVVSDSNIKFGTHPGRLMIVNEDNRKMWTIKMFLVGSRLYMLAVNNAKDMKPSDDTKKFFDSFKLVDR